MQVVSTDFLDAADAPANQPTFSSSVSWKKEYDPLTTLFTIGTSLIEGPDYIAGGGGAPTYFDKYLYYDESLNVNNFTIDRTISAIPIGIMSAQLDIEFDNTSKRYLPSYDPDIGNYIIVGRPIKVSVGFNKEAIPQFIGYTGRPSITLYNRVIRYHAFDAMEYLNNFEITLDMQTDISVNDMIELILDDAGFSPTQYDLEASLGESIKFIATKGLKAGTVIKNLVESELGVFFFDELSVAHFWNRAHFNLNSTSVATFSYDTVLDLKYVDTPVINHVRVRAKPRALMEYQAVWIMSGYIELEAGQTIQYIGGFSDQDGDLPVSSVGVPVSSQSILNDSFYTPNTANDGTGSDASADIVMSNFNSLGGTAFSVDFQNTSSSVRYISQMRIYGEPAKVTSYIEEEFKNDTSIEDNGLNPDDGGTVIEITNDYIQSDLAAAAYVDNLVIGNSSPRRQFVIPILPNPAYQFGDVVNVEIDDTSEDLKGVIMGNRISMSQDTAISQELVVEIRTFSMYFTIGTSIIAGPDVIAP